MSEIDITTNEFLMVPLTGDAVIELELMYGDSDAIWKCVDSSQSTDEGECTSTFTYQHVPSGEFWEFDYCSNSWAEVYDEAGDIKPYRVEPYEVTVTKYRKV